MNLNQWILKIKNINNNFFNKKDDLIDVLKKSNFVHFFLVQVNVNSKIYELINNYDYIAIWDCEFQNFKSNINDTTFIYNKLLIGNIIKLISEIGIIILIKPKTIVYFGAILHLNFVNKKFTSLNNYLPIYSDYMSVTSSTRVEIKNIEKSIYPHLIFNKIWKKYELTKNKKIFKAEIIRKLFKNITINKKLQELFYDLLNIINTDKKSNEIINNITNELKKKIYISLINTLPNNHKYKTILNLYLSDVYVKNTIIKNNNHANIIKSLNLMMSHEKCLNIIKGNTDIDALYNHTRILNNSIVSINNIIDIANYNNVIYETCGSAKLYESYICLYNIRNSIDLTIEKLIKESIADNFVPHNPLIDAYYTLQIFILFNIIYEHI